MQLAVALAAGLIGRTRRGIAGQLSRRALERRLRARVVALVRWARRHLGWTRARSAQRLGVSERTLRDWERHRRECPSVVARGRPAHRSDLDTRNAICEFLRITGPHVRLAELQRSFPQVPRGEATDFLARYRWICTNKVRPTATACRWTTPGTVWAMDHTTPPMLIDGEFPKILAVRDLASGKQLGALPTPDETALDVVGLLRRLFAQHGAPVVIKHDNGPAFTNHVVQECLAAHGVTALVSPPYTPRYNGACEAGIGHLKTRTQLRATRRDRPEAWTCDDVEYARCDGNAHGRPHGLGRPTADEAWAARPALAASDRWHFQQAVAQCADECAAERGAMAFEYLEPAAQRTVRRVAITHALLEHGWLELRRRRVPLPFPRRKAARVS